MTWVKSPVLVIVATQLLFTTGDLIARANMRHSPFTLSTFLSWWFVLYFLIRQVAMFGQLYVFSALQLGKTMAFFGATSIIVVNALGVLLLGEILSVQAYLAIGLVVLGFITLARPVTKTCLPHARKSSYRPSRRRIRPSPGGILKLVPVSPVRTSLAGRASLTS